MRGKISARKTVPVPRGDKLNLGSGQRPFDNRLGWINIDISKKHKPDLVGDCSDLSMFQDGSIQLVVAHHVLEHYGCNEGDPMIGEAYRVLRPGGSLIVCVPDLKALARRWLVGQLDDFSYTVNLYGAYQGEEGDRHKWGYHRESLKKYLVKWDWTVKDFDYREIPGASVARDFWILSLECVK